MPYSIIVIDDNPLVLESVKELIALTPQLRLDGLFSDVPSGLAYVGSVGSVDVVLCDVELPGIDGLKAKELFHGKCDLFVTFTGYGKYRKPATDAWVDGFVVKPLTVESLMRMVHKLDGNPHRMLPMKHELGKLLLYDGSVKIYKPVAYTDVVLIESSKNNLVVYLAGNREVVIRFTVKEAFAILEPVGIFLQVGPGVIVNTTHIKEAGTDYVSMEKANYSVTTPHMEAYNRFLSLYQFGKGNHLN